MTSSSDSIVRRARRLVSQFNTRDAAELAAGLGVTIMPVSFVRQRGVYKVIERNPFIFIKADLDPVMREIVILHELGHHLLHRREATQFQEFNIFDMRNDRMEFEANLFAAEIALPDADILEYISQGYDASQIAKAMYSDINLVALKASDLNRRGYSFKELDRQDDFLKYNK